MTRSESTNHSLKISHPKVARGLTASRRDRIIVQIVQTAKQSPFLTSRQLAASLGVSESSVKRWVDDGTIAAGRTAGGHRRISLAAAVGFIRSRRSPVVKPHLLPLHTAPRTALSERDAVDELHQALLEDQPSIARAIIGGRYLVGSDIAGLADGLIRPVMERLGELWNHGAEGILLEHRAVDACLHALSEIGSWLPDPAASAPIAVTAGAPEDPYLLSPMLTTLVLREAGIRTHNLGPLTPLEVVGLAMTRYGAKLCAISVSAPPVERAEAAWLALDKVVSTCGGRIVVGGRSSGSLPLSVRERVRPCGSMTELRAYASGWLEGTRVGTTRKGG